MIHEVPPAYARGPEEENMNVLVIGATGALGKAALRMFKQRGIQTRALAVHEGQALKIRTLADEIWIGDATRPETLTGLCEDVDLVFSALGKPVSLFSEEKASFHEIDFHGNANVIKEAALAGVERFVYVSIFGSEAYGDDFAVARAHRDVERLLQSSGMAYTILRPVGLFSGFLDLLTMAQRGAVITLGTGEARTNPIHYDDLVDLAGDNLQGENVILEAGGPEIFTRWELGEMASQAMGCRTHVRIPDLAAGFALPLMRFYDQAFFDKLAFFKQVLTTDAVATPRGIRRLEDFFHEAAEKMKAA